MKNKIASIIFSLIFIIPAFAQNRISLLNAEEVNNFLTLSSQQSKNITPIIEQIKNILEEDKDILTKLKERVKSGDEPGFFEKIGVKRGRDNRSGDIEDLIEAIEDELNDQQRNKFKNIEKPELKALKKEDVFGK